MQTRPVLTFDHYTVDVPNAQLWRGKRAIPLASQTFAVLRYLVAHAGQVVSKAELFDSLWPGTAVSDGALTFCIVELRKALGDNAKQPKFIETVHRRGYRFLPVVTTSPVVSSQSSVVSSGEEARGWRLETSPLSPPASSLKSLVSPIVGREAELAQLHNWLAKALHGERQIVFVTGELGIGKTTLIEKFVSEVSRRVGTAHPTSTFRTPIPNPQSPTPGVWVAVGQCIEQYGPGEPYMPILEALGRLCREPEGERLIALLQHHAPTWLVQMPTVLPATEIDALQRQIQGVTRERMLREMGEAIDAITAEHPLVLWLEDLHWSDASTLELLALLARRREPARLLVLSTYRPVDVIVQEHRLHAVKQELQLHGLCGELPLGSLSEAQVAEYLERRTEIEIERTQDRPRANAQGSQEETRILQLARILHRRTDGNPLFMVTVVDDLLSQGVLASVDGHWAVPDELATIETKVPENLQQLITQQIERLHTEERHLLEVASVAGMEFSAAALAAGVETETERVEEQCEEFVRRGQFLRAQGAADWPDGTVAERYSFLHALYQEVLYARLPAARRQRLHQRIGERGEQAYGERAKEIAAELAVHFAEGRDYQRAVQYRQYAAESAIQRYAHQEAETHLKKSLELLKLLPDTSQRTQQEFVLRTTLALTLQAIRGYGSPEVEQAYVGIRARVAEVQSRAQLVRMLFGLCQLHLARAEYETALEVGQQLLGIAEEEQDTGLLVEAHAVMGVTVFHQGEPQTVLTHLQRSADLYDRAQHRSHAAVYGQDPWVASQSYSGLALWLLGYPQQAVERASAALRYAQEIKHPFSHAFALHDLTLIYQFQRNLAAVQQHAEALLTLAREQKFPTWEISAKTLHAWVLVEQGQSEAGATIMRWGIDARLAIGMTLRIPYQQALLAEACGKNNQPEEGLVLMEKALATVARTGEHWWEADLYRLKGELLLQQLKIKNVKLKNPEAKGKRQKQASGVSSLLSVPSTEHPTPSTYAEAEECFLKALDVSRHQQAKSLELRATLSLARLWQSQGKRKEARKMLSEIYHWFTEGIDTKDLQEAKALLEELSH